ncbi:MAG: response regulator [Lachnospiraceae bacterium]|nr:response regulator [Lachnospiraceae bacterium]
MLRRKDKKKPSILNVDSEQTMKDSILRIYEVFVAIVLLLSIASIFLPHKNQSIWEPIFEHADQILNEKSFMILWAVFMAILLGQWVILYSKKQQMKYIQARKKNRETNDFLTLISHSIRTPLNGILGINAIIAHKNREDAVSGYVNQIDRAGESLLSNLDEILDFSKIEQNTIEIEEYDYDIARLICDCYQMMSARAEQKKLTFDVENDPNLPRLIRGDEVRIRQIILNILSNAIKYTSEGRVLFRVTCDRMGEKDVHLNIMVRDTGIGIDEKTLPHVFDAYKRIDVYKIRNVEGTGLGMAITKELVERMGGRIMVSSEPGDGTVFRVRIPQKIVDTYPVGAIDVSAMVNNARKVSWFFAPGVRALIVDDEPLNRRVLRGMMEPSGIWIEEADSGEDCLKMTRKESYDVILMDDRMPIMRGITCFDHIRNQIDGLNHDTPVIMVTANAGSGVEDQYLRLGFAAYIAKPIREGELISKLRVALKGKFLDL